MGVSKVSAFGNLCIQMKIFAPAKILFPLVFDRVDLKIIRKVNDF